MAELRDQEATRLGTADLDDSELLGFEWLEPQRDEDARTEQAIGIIFNKRGLVLLSHIFRRFAAPLDLVTCRFGWTANGGQDGALDAIE